MTVVLGLNAYHGDSSACLIINNQIVAAAEDERFRRIKHWAGFPSLSIAYCLSEGRISLSDVDIIAVNSSPLSSIFKRIEYTLRARPRLDLILDRLRNQSRRHSIEAELSVAFPDTPFRGKIQRVEHHLAHLASAFLVSPFRDSCLASIDGFGDFSSAAWGVGYDTTIDIEERIHFPHSLGIFYQSLTQFLGFPEYGDEYKVMGLAPYGRPDYKSALGEVVKLKEGGRFELNLQFFRHHSEKIDYAWEGGSPHVGKIFSPALIELLGPSRQKGQAIDQRHQNIASSVQAMYEEAFFHIINNLYEKHRLESLSLAGGCAMNSVANGKVMRHSPFKRLYVQPAAGDAGGAIGAAIYAWHQTGAFGNGYNKKVGGRVLKGDNICNRILMEHAYLGPSASDDEIKSLIDERGGEFEQNFCHAVRISNEEDLYGQTAEAISRGEIIGWFQGRMEWGPRALGNRSILCDPRRANVKEILNLKIKRRENFRPFAPSVLIEHVAEWFEEGGDVPFMMQVYQIRAEKRALIPAVTHVDGSGRLQTVYKETNPRYWRLIDVFREMTGVPMILNTSFNENEPIVCKPVEALDCFLRTKMDVLVLGDYFIRRLPRPDSEDLTNARIL